MTDQTWLGRSQLILGTQGLDALKNAQVLVVGLGGVGSYAAEFLVRSGLGNITIVDGDVVDPTNRNRQLPALATTHGQFKATLMAERLQQINPELKISTHQEFINTEQIIQLLSTPFDYVLDAIDSVTPKLALISAAYRQGYRVVSAMGAGGKIDPISIRIGDIAVTKVCPLASHIRRQLRKQGILTGIKAVFSIEPVIRSSLMLTDGSNFKKSAYGTMSYLPAAFGGACASVIIRDLCNLQIANYERPTKKIRRINNTKT
ncbi:MAG: tRNA threonylcarbamoyladenosine dehydratase [Bacteroidia bacterium]|nr:tRNA threonylcarbamoyladenosine dehydratase [Bacteroidia bacterium]